MLAFERHGSGEPLVLVHGITHRRQAWYPVLDQLAAQREVYLVDLPGHGASPAFEPDGLPVAEALRRDFRSFLEQQGLVDANRPHVAGNSLGGRVALEAGASGDARSVTALSPAGFWRNDAAFAPTKRLFTSASQAVESLGTHASALSRSRAGRSAMYGLLMAHPSRVPADHALGDLRAFDYARPALRSLLAAASTFDAQIPEDVPVTIAWASRDLVLPPWQAKYARELLPNATHIMMRGVGHVPMFDDADMVARVLLAGSEPVAAVRRLDTDEPAAPVRTRRRRAVAATA